MRLRLLFAALTLTAAACGQRGPLYLRDSPPPGVRPPPPKPYEPVPYPRDLPDEHRSGVGEERR